jgi:protein-disulfide isomerase
MAKKTTTDDRVLFFSSPYCGPCEEAKEVIDKDPELKKRIRVVDTTTDRGDKLAEAHKIEVTPTFVRGDGKRLEGLPDGPRGLANLKRFVGGGR